jgi:hypothetical protein
MKLMPKIVLALSAFATMGVSAEMVYSGQSDQERRERNREEALSHYRAGNTTWPKVRQEAHEAANSARHAGHEVAESTRSATHKVANEGRRVGHKVAVEAREATARADAKFGTVEKKDGTGEASNPTGRSNTAPNGPKP